MIDSNGVYTPLAQADALAQVTSYATGAGLTVTPGSVEQILTNALTQFLLYTDNQIGLSVASATRPSGANIDAQNPGTPRGVAQFASGYIVATNPTGSPITIPGGTNFTCSNSLIYISAISPVIVPASSTAQVQVTAQNAAAAGNIPSGLTFTCPIPNLTFTNLLPFLNGADAESDAQYLARIIYLRTNYTSQQATPAAEIELQQSYKAARIYVNNSANAVLTPVPIPAGGYNAIVLTPSGASASALEINNALQILANRFEFGNAQQVASATHPILSGTIYNASTPQLYFFTPAQNVQTTINANLSVRFAANTDPTEKNKQALAFAQYFAQNLIDYFGGAGGSANVTFIPLGGPANPQTVAVNPVTLPVVPPLAPAFSIEQIRALISDESFLSTLLWLSYASCNSLSVTCDPQVMGQPATTLDITPYGTNFIDFANQALFTDGTSWYDRYIYLDPSLISITVVETT